MFMHEVDEVPKMPRALLERLTKITCLQAGLSSLKKVTAQENDVSHKVKSPTK